MITLVIITTVQFLIVTFDGYNCNYKLTTIIALVIIIFQFKEKGKEKKKKKNKLQSQL